jgi:glycosyltransferase involved in cell wall biosynthesis
MEENVGHATLAHHVRTFMAEEPSVESRYAPITFYEPGGLVERLPLPSYVRAAYRARIQVKRGLHGWRPDVLLWNTQKPAMFCPDLLLRVPSVICTDVTPRQYDELGDVYGHDADGRGPVGAAKHLAAKRIFNLAQHLAPWTQWAAESLARDYAVPWEKITVLPPGTDLTRFRPAVSKPSETDGRVRLLFVGGDFERKGGDVLLQLFHNSPLSTKAVLQLVTQADVTPSANVEVHRLGAEDPQLTRLYEEADIFVLPTKAECFGIVLTEAAAAGLPSVTCPVGGVGEIVEHEGSGLHVPPGDCLALGAALEALIGDPERRRGYGRRAREIAESRFDHRANARRLIELLRDAVDEKSKPVTHPERKTAGRDGAV